MNPVFTLFAAMNLDDSEYRQSLAGAESATRDAGRGMEQAIDQSTRSIEQRLVQAGESMQRVGGGMSRWITGPLVALGAAAVASANQLGSAADAILDLGDITGLSTERIQAYRAVTREAGIDTDAFATAAEGLQRRLSATGEESAGVQETLDLLGVSVRNADGSLRSMDDLLPDVVAGLAGMENPAQRNAAALQVLGRQGTALAPALGLGTQRIEELTRAAMESGEVLSGDALEAANAYRIEWENARAELGLAGREIQVAIIPAVTLLMQLLRDHVIPVVRDFAERIAAVVQWFTDLDERLQVAIIGFGAVVAAIGPLLVIGGKLLTMVPLITSAFTALRTALLLFTGPLGIAAVAAGALGLLVYRLATRPDSVAVAADAARDALAGDDRASLLSALDEVGEKAGGPTRDAMIALQNELVFTSDTGEVVAALDDVIDKADGDTARALARLKDRLVIGGDTSAAVAELEALIEVSDGEVARALQEVRDRLVIDGDTTAAVAALQAVIAAADDDVRPALERLADDLVLSADASGVLSEFDAIIRAADDSLRPALERIRADLVQTGDMGEEQALRIAMALRRQDVEQQERTFWQRLAPGLQSDQVDLTGGLFIAEQRGHLDREEINRLLEEGTRAAAEAVVESLDIAIQRLSMEPQQPVRQVDALRRWRDAIEADLASIERAYAEMADVGAAITTPTVTPVASRVQSVGTAARETAEEVRSATEALGDFFREQERHPEVMARVAGREREARWAAGDRAGVPVPGAIAPGAADVMTRGTWASRPEELLADLLGLPPSRELRAMTVPVQTMLVDAREIAVPNAQVTMGRATPPAPGAMVPGPLGVLPGALDVRAPMDPLALMGLPGDPRAASMTGFDRFRQAEGGAFRQVDRAGAAAEFAAMQREQQAVDDLRAEYERLTAARAEERAAADRQAAAVAELERDLTAASYAAAEYVNESAAAEHIAARQADAADLQRSSIDDLTRAYLQQTAAQDEAARAAAEAQREYEASAVGIAALADEHANIVRVQEQLGQATLNDVTMALIEQQGALQNAIASVGEGSTEWYAYADALAAVEQEITQNQLTAHQQHVDALQEQMEQVGVNSREYEGLREQLNATLEVMRALGANVPDLGPAGAADRVRAAVDAFLDRLGPLGEGLRGVAERVVNSTSLFSGGIEALAAGPMAGLGAVLGDVIGRSEGFQNMLEALGRILDPVVKVFDYLFNAVTRFINAILPWTRAQEEEAGAPRGSIAWAREQRAEVEALRLQAVTAADRERAAAAVHAWDTWLERAEAGTLGQWEPSPAEVGRPITDADRERRSRWTEVEGPDAGADPGSIAYWQERMRAARDAWTAAGTAEARAVAQQRIDIIQAAIDAIQRESEIVPPGEPDPVLGRIEELQEDRASLLEQRLQATDEAAIARLNREIRDVDDAIRRLLDLGLEHEDEIGDVREDLDRLDFGATPQTVQFATAVPLAEAADRNLYAAELFAGAMERLLPSGDGGMPSFAVALDRHTPVLEAMTDTLERLMRDGVRIGVETMQATTGSPTAALR